MFTLSANLTRGHPLKLVKKRCNTTQCLNTLSMRIVDHQNILSEDTVTANSIRDRPFNLQGGGGWGLCVFFFCSDFLFGQHESYNIFFLSRNAEINIRLYDKNSESEYFFSSTKIRIFFQEKTITPPHPTPPRKKQIFVQQV